MGKNTITHLIQIFEQNTSQDKMLTKNEILQLLVDNYDDIIEQKQFYRKIEDLRNEGYDVIAKKGPQAKYYLRRETLSKEEWVYLISLIYYNKNISKKETERIIACLLTLNPSNDCKLYYNKYKSKLSSNKNLTSQMKKFKLILNAIEDHTELFCKVILSSSNNEYTFSELKVIRPLDFYFLNGALIIKVKEQNRTCEYPIISIIDVDKK